MRTVIDHGMKPVIRDQQFDDWASQMAAIARSTNVLCKLSGLATEAAPGWTVETLKPYGRHIIDSFGPDRVMWGSDWPVLTLNGSYDQWFSAAQGLVQPAERAAIFGGTAQAFYRI
jgi:L-fuconolactonase